MQGEEGGHGEFMCGERRRGGGAGRLKRRGTLGTFELFQTYNKDEANKAVGRAGQVGMEPARAEFMFGFI